MRLYSEASLVSKQSLLVLNNVLLVSSCALVLCGTLWPLFAELQGWPKASVGAPWFGLYFGYIVAPLMVLVPLGAWVKWDHDPSKWVRTIVLIAGAVFFIGVVLGETGSSSLRSVGGALLGFWVIFGTAAFLFNRWRTRPAGSRFTVEMFAMSCAHFGIGLWMLGVIAVETLSVERDVRLSPGESVQVGNYSLKMLGVEQVQGPNFDASEGRFELRSGEQVIATLAPQKRMYRRGNVMTEAAIHPSLRRDIYVALGEPLEQGAWAVRAYHKPFIRLIWLGALFMAFGGILGIFERRLRRRVTQAPSLAAEGVSAS